MATCPMCNADDVSDDMTDMTGHDMSKHPEASDQQAESSSDDSSDKNQ